MNMLTKEQITIGDKILKYIKKNNDRIDHDGYITELPDFEHELFAEAVHVKDYMLNELDLLVQYGATVHHIRLTRKGENAVDMGLESYIKSLDKDEQRLKDSIKWNVRRSWIAIAISILVPIGVKVYEKQFDNKIDEPTKAYIQSQVRHYSDSVNSAIELRDSLLIQKFKHSLKHDTTFLKELAKAIDGLKNTP